jgi:tetratricopeptide repeat protein
VADNPRIEELRRRVLADPASIAFAALAEEYRRIGHYEEAITTCRAGLQRHPAYLSARVTLGRALIETGDYDAAREELQTVLKSAPENLAAIRGLAQIHERMGHSAEMDPQLAEMMANVEPLPPRAPEPPPVQVAPPPPPPPPHVEPEPEPVHEAVPLAALVLEAEPEPAPETRTDPFASFAFVPEPTHEVAPNLSFELDASAPRHETLQGSDSDPAAFEVLDEIFAAPLDAPENQGTREPGNLKSLMRLEQFLGAIQHARSELSAHR